MPLSLNDVSAWVAIGDRELDQYGIEEDVTNKQVTCWIATEADKSFSIVFRDDAAHREHALLSKLQFDGSKFSGKVLHPPTEAPGMAPNSIASRTVVHRTRRVSATSICSFMFSKVELTEEDEYLGQGSAHLGEIRIRIYRIQYLGKGPPKDVVGPSSHVKVHEREKKAVTHCVSYGREMKKKSDRYSRLVEYLDKSGGRNVPLATFIFKYRDSGLLQANGIIPKTPSAGKKPVGPLSLTTGNNVKPEVVDDEIEIVEGTPRSMKRAAARTRKSSGRRYDARPAKKIKRETEFVPTGEVIDLT